jgi:TetR/AcrR family transcriptional regulator, fatty acid metabolism regulator protein
MRRNIISKRMSKVETKKRILTAAEKVFFEKGGDNVKISEIAKEAEITESTIYYHFKDKEDLLFSIPVDKMMELYENIKEQLQGIRDPISRLRKFIWFHLFFYKSNIECSSLVLFECRSRNTFYKHSTYQLFKKYSYLLLSILEDGINKKIFRPDVNMKIVRDIIFGGLEWEALHYISRQVRDDILLDFEDIMSLILPMIIIPDMANEEKSDKSIRILLAAETMFARKGYTYTTITEIAQRANVSEGTVYEYFKNKESLLLTINKLRFEELNEGLEEIFNIKNPERKLRRLIRHHYAFYLIKRDFLKIWLFEIQYNRKFYLSDAYEPIKRFERILNSIMEEGKKENRFRKDVNNRIFMCLLLGGYSQLELRWFVKNQRPKETPDTSSELDEFSNLMIGAVTPKNYFKGFKGEL